jgi:hypothetical protein
LKNPVDELLADLSTALQPMDDDAMEIIDFTNLLLELTADAQIAPENIPGIHRILGTIFELGHSLNKHKLDARHIARRLADLRSQIAA